MHICGLYDHSQDTSLYFPAIDLGGEERYRSGTSSILKSWAMSDGESVSIKLAAFDESLNNRIDFNQFKQSQKKGLLWLDVEGTALEALRGMSKILPYIMVAKIEVEYLIQVGQWSTRNLFKVILLLLKFDFLPVRGYLHPLSRGDLMFVKRKKLNFICKLKSFTYFSLLVFFYGFLYPIRSKLRDFIVLRT